MFANLSLIKVYYCFQKAHFKKYTKSWVKSSGYIVVPCFSGSFCSMTYSLGSSLSQLQATIFLVLFLFWGAYFWISFLDLLFLSYPLNMGVPQDSILAPLSLHLNTVFPSTISSKPMVSINIYLYQCLDHHCPNAILTLVLHSTSPVRYLWVHHRDLKIMSRQNPNSLLSPISSFFCIPSLSTGF